MSLLFRVSGRICTIRFVLALVSYSLRAVVIAGPYLGTDGFYVERNITKSGILGKFELVERFWG